MFCRMKLSQVLAADAEWYVSIYVIKELGYKVIGLFVVVMSFTPRSVQAIKQHAYILIVENAHMHTRFEAAYDINTVLMPEAVLLYFIGL